jgi:uncharacterized protein with PhoU and TrkA domain
MASRTTHVAELDTRRIVHVRRRDGLSCGMRAPFLDGPVQVQAGDTLVVRGVGELVERLAHAQRRDRRR